MRRRGQGKDTRAGAGRCGLAYGESRRDKEGGIVGREENLVVGEVGGVGGQVGG